MKYFIFMIAGFLFATNYTLASTPAMDLLHTAKAMKAIIEKGYSIPAIIDVQTVIQMSIPAKECILVVYDRKPNTTCPDEFGQGPFLDKAWVACFNPSSDEVDYVGGSESMCTPQN